jgi:hypothetical protein
MAGTCGSRIFHTLETIFSIVWKNGENFSIAWKNAGSGPEPRFSRAEWAGLRGGRGAW